MLVSDAIEKYCDSMPSHVIKDRRAHLKSWRKFIGHMALADVTSATIAQVRDKLLISPSPNRDKLSPGTVNRHLTTLSHLYNIAMREWGYTGVNPVRMIRKPKEPRGITRLLSAHERRELLHSCSTIDAKLHLLVLMALSTGARAGELLNLTWADIDLGPYPSVTFRDTKNGETRSVPLTGEVLAKLHLHGPNDGLVFPSDNHSLKPMAYHIAFKKACALAKLHCFRFHDLRHAAASYLVMSGASMREVAEILGHKSMTMTMRYSHISKEHLRVTMERLTASL